jgi:hypothetical protein
MFGMDLWGGVACTVVFLAGAAWYFYLVSDGDVPDQTEFPAAHARHETLRGMRWFLLASGLATLVLTVLLALYRLIRDGLEGRFNLEAVLVLTTLAAGAVLIAGIVKRYGIPRKSPTRPIEIIRGPVDLFVYPILLALATYLALAGRYPNWPFRFVAAALLIYMAVRLRQARRADADAAEQDPGNE